MNERPSDQPFTRTVSLGSRAQDRVQPQEARKALEKIIREIPEDRLRAAGVLFASFRGGQITVIV